MHEIQVSPSKAQAALKSLRFESFCEIFVHNPAVTSAPPPLTCDRETHLISRQPFQYRLRCVSGDLSPEVVLCLIAALALQQCPEGLGQLQNPEGRVRMRGNLQLWCTL